MTIDPIEPLPTRWETVRSIASGLLPYEGDLFDLFDGLRCLWGAFYHLSHLLVRVVMMLCFPLTIAVLYPFVRHLHRRRHVWRLEEGKRRQELIDRLTVLTQKGPTQ